MRWFPEWLYVPGGGEFSVILSRRSKRLHYCIILSRLWKSSPRTALAYITQIISSLLSWDFWMKSIMRTMTWHGERFFHLMKQMPLEGSVVEWVQGNYWHVNGRQIWQILNFLLFLLYRFETSGQSLMGHCLSIQQSQLFASHTCEGTTCFVYVLGWCITCGEGSVRCTKFCLGSIPHNYIQLTLVSERVKRFAFIALRLPNLSSK